MGQVLSLRPEQGELEQAWADYEEALSAYRALADDPARSTVKQRFDAAMRANRLHRQFYRLCGRAEAGQ